MKKYLVPLMAMLTLTACSSVEVKEMSCTELREHERKLTGELKELNIDRILGVVGTLANDKELETSGEISGVVADITEDELKEVRAQINHKRCNALKSHAKK